MVGSSAKVSRPRTKVNLVLVEVWRQQNKTKQTYVPAQGRQKKIPSCSQEGQPVWYIQALTDWEGPTHMRGSNLLYSNSDVALAQKHPHKRTRKTFGQSTGLPMTHKTNHYRSLFLFIWACAFWFISM